MSAEDREAARGEAWGGQVRAVRRALTTAMRGGRARGEDWEAIRQLLGGVVRRSAAAGGWGEREMRGRVRGIAGAITWMQDLVWGGVCAWKMKTATARGKYLVRNKFSFRSIKNI